MKFHEVRTKLDNITRTKLDNITFIVKATRIATRSIRYTIMVHWPIECQHRKKPNATLHALSRVGPGGTTDHDHETHLSHNAGTWMEQERTSKCSLNGVDDDETQQFRLDKQCDYNRLSDDQNTNDHERDGSHDSWGVTVAVFFFVFFAVLKALIIIISKYQNHSYQWHYVHRDISFFISES